MSASDSASDVSNESQPVRQVDYPVGTETEVPDTNGGLHKTVLVEGTGTHPVKGAKVTVHYVGTLASDGSKFDSSRDRGEYFEFTLGRGQVIQGWDRGVATMRVGEKCILRCSPDYAYGAAGSPPKIPPNSTLLFEVELFDWSKETDVSADKDGSIMKNTIAEGVDYDKPGFESVVTMDLRVHHGTPDEGKLVAERVGWKLIIGDEAMPPCLETCLATMRKKESSTFRVAAAAVMFPFAELHIAAGEALTYSIELHELETVKTWQFTGRAKLDEGARRKAEGNTAFSAGNLMQAERKYRRALEFVESDYGIDDADKQDGVTLRVAVWGNLAQVLLQRQQYGEVITMCNKILEAEPRNVKALFRMARAADAKGEWEEARRHLERLLEVDAANVDAKQFLQHVQQEQREYDKKQRALFKNMFA